MELFIAWIILSIFPGVIAKNKGYSFGGFFLLSLVLSPLIGFIWVLVMKPNEAGQVQSGQSRKCPYCAEMIRPDAIICRFCHKDLPACTPPPPPPSQRMLTPEERKKTKWSWLVVLLVILGAIALFLGIDYLENGYNSVVFKFLESLQK